MELKISNPTDVALSPVEFNFDELKTELAQGLKKYENLVYSDSNIAEAKKDRANLNKLKTAIEDRRKEMKKYYLAPYEAFEVKIKEITTMIDKPILAIDAQVKNFEQIKQDEKLDGIKTFYADHVGDLTKLVPFDKIYNPKWMNVTYKGADIEKEITDLFIKVESDLKVIGELQTEYELQIKDVYLKAFDLTAALQEKKRLEERAAEIEEHKRIQQEKEQQAKASVAPTQEARRQPDQPPQESKPSAPESEEPKQYVMDFRVWGTREQLLALKQYLMDNNYKYGKVGE